MKTITTTKKSKNIFEEKRKLCISISCWLILDLINPIYTLKYMFVIALAYTYLSRSHSIKYY